MRWRMARATVLATSASAAEGRVGKFFAREHRQHPVEFAGDEQRITREGDHALAPRPFLVTHARVADDVVGEVRRAFGGDEADLEFAQRHTAVRAVEVGVQAGADGEFERLGAGVVGPDPREGRAGVGDERLGAALEQFVRASRGG